jgi:hypothetical protein
MCPIGLPSLAFLAEPQLASRFDCEGRRHGRIVGWKGIISSLALCRRPGTREDSCGVRPIQKEVKNYTDYSGSLA